MTFGNRLHKYLTKLEREGTRYEVKAGTAKTYGFVVDYSPDHLLLADDDGEHFINLDTVTTVSIRVI